jgi:riboflavin biosynthesis pyrimidine reductase
MGAAIGGVVQRCRGILLGPYDPDAIRALKTEVDGDLYTSGSATLARATLADGLVDEMHLLVYPLTRGPARGSPRTSSPTSRVLAPAPGRFPSRRSSTSPTAP